MLCFFVQSSMCRLQGYKLTDGRVKSKQKVILPKKKRKIYIVIESKTKKEQIIVKKW